jgi:hypothetical protein
MAGAPPRTGDPDGAGLHQRAAVDGRGTQNASVRVRIEGEHAA